MGLVKLGRKVGIKFVPVPANEKTIARREKEGKPTLPNGFEESEKLEDGEEALPEDAKVVEGKDVLAKIKAAAKITYLKEIPGTSQKKEGGENTRGENTRNNNRNNNRNQKNKSSENAEVKKEGETGDKVDNVNNKENNNKRQQNRKRSNTDNKVDESGEAKKSKMADGVKKENGAGNKGERRNNTSGGARGARASGNRGSFTSTRGGARGGGSQSAGKSIYREQ